MSYQVLARKWRPRRFADLVGQTHVARALINALDHDRLHHAFLFTGTRGVGKTTIARILAKSLNCETGVSSQPCGTCQACREVDEGRFVDLIEVDAASRTKVDDTRELLDNVQYAPTRGRYKVYLIDEVHMLSGHSFNALLKTLEEPPPHVKFLLATTDPQKLPVTVLSRCLQFHLKRLSPELIEQQLDKILKAENITHEPAALALLARSADGSMRDALSLLDQAIAFGAGKVAEAEVRDMLGTIDDRLIDQILGALMQDDAGALVACSADAYERNADPEGVLGSLLVALHRIAVLQATGPSPVSGLDDQPILRECAERLSPEDVQLFYQIGLIGRRDLPLAPDTRTGLEMTLLRMLAFRPVTAEHGQVAATRPAAAVRPAAPPAAATTRPAVPDARASAPQAGSWNEIVSGLGVTALVRELAVHSQLDAIEGDRVAITLDEAYAHLHNKEREAALSQALAAQFGRDIRLQVTVGQPTDTPAREKQRYQAERQQAAADAILNDPAVRRLQDEFSAKINPASIQPKR